MRPLARVAACGLAGLALGAAGLPARAGPIEGVPVVEGEAEALYAVGTAAAVPSYSNQGFRQELDGPRLRVRVRAAPAWTRAPFSLPAAIGPDDAVAGFAADAARGATTRAEAVASLLHAVAARVRYAAAPGLAEEPASVLTRGEASCVGLANLAVAALRSLGLPARVARGVRVDRSSGEAVPHRWIEVFYPDAGWVFSDPTESINYVSAEHVVLTPPGDPDPAYDPAVAVAHPPSLLGLSDRLVAVDLRPGRPSRLGERRLHPAQYAAAVVGRVVPDRPGSLRLVGRDRVWESRVAAGQAFSFPGLAPGRYTLEGSFGAEAASLAVSVLEGQVVEVEVKLR